MALIGLKNIYYAKLTKDDTTGATYETPKKIGNAISVDIKTNSNTAKLYGDDMAVASNTTILDSTVTIETTDIPMEDRAILLGHTVHNETGLITAKGSDSPPYVAILFESDTHDGKTRYYKWLKGKFAPTQETINTRGENLEYQTPKMEATFVARQYDGAYEMIADSDNSLSESLISSWYESV